MNQPSHLHRLSGFTLIELTVSSAIISLIVTGISLLIVNAFSNVNNITTKIDLASQTKQTMERISRETRLASNLPTTTTIDGVTYQASTTTLILSVPGITNTGEPITGISDTIVYRRNPVTNTLDEIIQPGNGSTRPNHTKSIYTLLKSITFETTGQSPNKVVSITLTGEQVGQSRPIQMTLKSQIIPRNQIDEN